MDKTNSTGPAFNEGMNRPNERSGKYRSVVHSMYDEATLRKVFKVETVSKGIDFPIVQDEVKYDSTTTQALTEWGMVEPSDARTNYPTSYRSDVQVYKLGSPHPVTSYKMKEPTRHVSGQWGSFNNEKKVPTRPKIPKPKLTIKEMLEINEEEGY